MTNGNLGRDPATGQLKRDQNSGQLIRGITDACCCNTITPVNCLSDWNFDSAYPGISQFNPIDFSMEGFECINGFISIMSTATGAYTVNATAIDASNTGGVSTGFLIYLNGVATGWWAFASRQSNTGVDANWNLSVGDTLLAVWGIWSGAPGLTGFSAQPTTSETRTGFTTCTDCP